MRKEKQITRCLTLNILFPRNSSSNRWKFQDRRPAGRPAKKKQKKKPKKKKGMDKVNNSN